MIYPSSTSTAFVIDESCCIIIPDENCLDEKKIGCLSWKTDDCFLVVKSLLSSRKTYFDASRPDKVTKSHRTFFSIFRKRFPGLGFVCIFQMRIFSLEIRPASFIFSLQILFHSFHYSFRIPKYSKLYYKMHNKTLYLSRLHILEFLKKELFNKFEN